MIWAIRNGAVTGAVVGAGVAIELVTLDIVRPFSVFINLAVENLTFRMCPLYILGFVNGMGSMANVIIVAIVGNAIL